MQNTLKINGAGVGSLVSARLLANSGYNVTVNESDTIPVDYVDVFFKGTLLGSIKINGYPKKDAQTLKALESNARSTLITYFKNLPNSPKTKRYFFSKLDSVGTYTEKHFSTVELQMVLQFPFIFLGVNPYKTIPYPDILIDASKPASHLLAIRLELKTQYRDLAIHNFVLSKKWHKGLHNIFYGRKWPNDPVFYVGKAGKRELIIEVPVSSSLTHTASELEHYSEWIIKQVGESLHLTDLEKRIKKTTVISSNVK